MKSKIKKTIFIALLLISTLFNNFSFSNIDYTKITITTLNERNIPISKTIEEYNEQGNCIYKENYQYNESQPYLYSVIEFYYDKKNNLYKELYLTPNYSFIFKTVKYSYKLLNEKDKLTLKKEVDYTSSLYRETNYQYLSNGLLENEVTTFYYMNRDEEIYQEIEYRYNNNAKIKQKIIYKSQDNSNVYKPIYINYEYDVNGFLSETKSYNSENKPLEIIKFFYDNSQRLYRKDIYRAEVVLSENDQYFERRYIREKSITYEYD